VDLLHHYQLTLKQVCSGIMTGIVDLDSSFHLAMIVHSLHSLVYLKQRIIIAARS